ncbi:MULTISPECIES: sugar transferase [Bacteria]|uniref:sugar transferase n=1 Tax=Bacteria TaxID=2 RepID=UPI003C7D06CD
MTKRALDVAGAAVALVLLSPAMALIAVLVLVNLGRPVVFAQTRPGLHGRLFTLRKFRSMRAVDPGRGMVTDAQRLTRFGRILRSTSLDELPSLWNVLRGDMSFVGPRPLLVEYLPRYTPAQARRHEVRPGITGLAQANGRNGISWERKLRLDVEYVDRRSLALDAAIVLRTVRVVVHRQGIATAGSVSAMEFRGSGEE